MKKVIVVDSEEETRTLGTLWGKILSPGIMICLTGPLGAGKTVLASGILAGAGIPGPHRSPTFTLVWEHEGAFKINHVDLYRLSSDEAVGDLPWEEMISEGASSIVEWADRLPPDALAPDRLEVCIVPDEFDLSRRRITVDAHGRCRAMIEGGEGSC